MRSKLIAEKIRIETQRIYSENTIPALKFQLQKRVSKRLADLTQDFITSISAKQGAITNWQVIATDLRDSVAKSVRSISHDLWNQNPQNSIPVLTPFEIARVLVSTVIRGRSTSTTLESTIKAAKIEALSTELLCLRFKKDIATYLHGNLQSRLLAISFAIELAGEHHDYIELANQLDAAAQIIVAPFDHFFEAEPESLTAEIAKLTHTWNALISTSLINFGNDDDVSVLDSKLMLSCIEEGLSNALRHGCATNVAIGISTTTHKHAISMTDNGIGPREGSPGLGSSLFNSVAGSNWSLARGPDGVGAQLNLQISK